jgi:hypothetical protein
LPLPFDDATEDVAADADAAGAEWASARDARGAGRCGAGAAGDDADAGADDFEADTFIGAALDAALRFCASLSRQLPAPLLLPPEVEAAADAADDAADADCERSSSARGACMRPAIACERLLLVPLPLEWPPREPCESRSADLESEAARFCCCMVDLLSAMAVLRSSSDCDTH